MDMDLHFDLELELEVEMHLALELVLLWDFEMKLELEKVVRGEAEALSNKKIEHLSHMGKLIMDCIREFTGHPRPANE